jgi:NitT/TauT family transport system substrate-binding protein
MALRPGAKNRPATTNDGANNDPIRDDDNLLPLPGGLRPARLRRPGAVAAIAVPAMLVLSSCSLLNGSDSASSAGTTGAAAQVEHPNISVGFLKIADSAPFEIALQRGYFKQEGLNVTAKPVVSGTESVPKVSQGALDFGLTNWATLLTAQEKKVDDFKIVADGAQGKSGDMAVTTYPGSGITKITDLAGKNVSSNALNDVPYLALLANLKANGIDPNLVHMTVIHHPDTPQALAQKKVDAAIQLEPYKTQAARMVGARPVVDLFGPGPAENLPLAGWFTTAKFANANPKTVAAFRRAMEHGAADAADRKKVEDIVPTYTTIDKQTVALINLPGFPTTLDAKRLQRVADLMQQYGFLTNHLDLASMVDLSKPAS